MISLENMDVNYEKFRLLGDIGCCGAEVLPSLPVVADEGGAA